MTHVRMHEDELDIDDALVRGLLRAQQPQWADLPLRRVVSSGTDNAMFRLGDDMVARLPRIECVVGAADARGAMAAGARIPPATRGAEPHSRREALGTGIRGGGRSTPGSTETTRSRGGSTTWMRQPETLAGFIGALHAIDTADAPPSGRGRRGAPLAVLDQQTRQAIEAARGLVDRETVTAAWEAAMGQPSWHRDPVWVHGDIARGNLLVHGGRIRAVIDFGCSGVGDPACDLLVAWDLFDARLTPWCSGKR